MNQDIIVLSNVQTQRRKLVPALKSIQFYHKTRNSVYLQVDGHRWRNTAMPASLMLIFNNSMLFIAMK